MPKETFYKISEEKRERILGALRKTFETKPFFEVSIKEVMEGLNIARICRSFMKEWTKEEFLKHYNEHKIWLEKGVYYEDK